MKKPAYLCVYKSLKSNIIGGEYKIGSLIPPEPTLCDMYGVSRTTIRKAVEMLIKDGFITVKQGFGTQVISQKTNQNLNCLTSISQTLSVKGYEIGVKNVYIEELNADRSLAQEFDVDIGTPLMCVNRIQLADNNPVTIAKNYILASLVPKLQNYTGEIKSLYSFLKENYDLSYTTARDTISACNASYEEAAVLEVPPKTALISVKRKCYLGDSVAELDLVKIIGDKYEFEIFMQNS